MSYSFSAKAATKAEAKVLIAEKLAEVSVNQPNHERDIVQAQVAADMFVDLLATDPTKVVFVNVSGSLGWDYAGAVDPVKITSSNVSVSAYLSPKE